jgi:cell division protein FtsW
VAKQAVWTLIGFGAMVFAMYFDYRVLADRRVVLGLLVVTSLMLMAVFGFSRVNGAHRWIKLAGFSLQPSEIAKLTLAVFLAYFLEKRMGEEHLLLRTFMPCVLVTGFLAALVLKEPDLGTALILGSICVTICFSAGIRVLHLGLAAAPALVVGIGMLVFVPWRFKRLLAFTDPWKYAQAEGYQVVQSLIAVGSGGVHGLGFAQGRQKMFFLPFAHSDFIFAVVGEELGMVGALIVVMIFALFLWRGLRAALNAPDRFGMLLGIGIVVSIVVQAMFNISVVLSLVPNKGIPLPFISYGGSSLVPTLFSVGLLLNISQYAGSGSGGSLEWAEPQSKRTTSLGYRQRNMVGSSSFSSWRHRARA